MLPLSNLDHLIVWSHLSVGKKLFASIYLYCSTLPWPNLYCCSFYFDYRWQERCMHHFFLTVPHFPCQTRTCFTLVQLSMARKLYASIYLDCSALPLWNLDLWSFNFKFPLTAIDLASRMMDQVKFRHLAYPSHNGDNPLGFRKGYITKHAAASTVAAVR